MSDTPLAFLVMVTYDVWEKERERFLELIERVKENALDIGAQGYQLLADDDQPCRFTEIMVFDSWSQYRRVQAEAPSRAMQDVYAEIAECTIGGPGESQVRYLNLLAEA
jgi:hypothetical protein